MHANSSSLAGTVLGGLGDVVQLGTTRCMIVARIRADLVGRSEQLDDWEATHFANAINALAMNVNALQQPTTAWLRLCLDDLAKAETPAADRHEPYGPRTTDGGQLARPVA